MRRLFFVLAALVPLLLASSPGNAVRDPDPRTSRFELLVIEAPGCAYCEILRREVLPLHRTATGARHVPIRFVDANEIDDNSPLLSEPVTIVPTAVLLREGREVARITGYAGPQMLLRLIQERAPSVD